MLTLVMRNGEGRSHRRQQPGFRVQWIYAGLLGPREKPIGIIDGRTRPLSHEATRERRHRLLTPSWAVEWQPAGSVDGIRGQSGTFPERPRAGTMGDRRAPTYREPTGGGVSGCSL